MSGEAEPEEAGPPMDGSLETPQSEAKQGGKKKREWKKATNLADFYAPPSYAASKSRGGGKGGKGGFDGEGRGRGKGGKGGGKGYGGEAGRAPLQDPQDPEASKASMAAGPGGDPGSGPGFDGMDGGGSPKGGGKKSPGWKPSGGGKCRDGKGKGAGKGLDSRKGGKGPGMAPPSADQQGPPADAAAPGTEVSRPTGPQRMPGTPGSPKGGPAAGPRMPMGMSMPGMPMAVPGAMAPGGAMAYPGAVYMPSYFVAAMPPHSMGPGSPLSPSGGCIPAFTPLSGASPLYVPGAHVPGSPGGMPRPQMLVGGMGPGPQGGDIKEQVRGQIEYWFGPENLAKDFFLRQQMNEEGWVPVEVIANFNKVKERTTDVSVVVEAITASETLELDGASTHVRCRENWHSWLLKSQSPTAAGGGTA